MTRPSLWVDLSTVQLKDWIYSCCPKKWRAITYKAHPQEDGDPQSVAEGRDVRHFPGIMIN
jgi:hypothetical protein